MDKKNCGISYKSTVHRKKKKKKELLIRSISWTLQWAKESGYEKLYAIQFYLYKAIEQKK